MIKDFLIINCIGKDDKLGLRINKDFFTHKFVHKKNNDLQRFDLENIEKIIDKNLIEKKLIKPIYIS